MLNIPRYASQITPCLPQSGTSSPAQAVFRKCPRKSKRKLIIERLPQGDSFTLFICGSIVGSSAIGERVEENYKLKGCHVKILSLLIICGSIAVQPAICNGYKNEIFISGQ
jgi:hypothetical protein